MAVKNALGRRDSGRDCWRAYACAVKYLRELRSLRWLVVCALFLGIISGFSSGFAMPILLKYLVRRIFDSPGTSIKAVAFYCSLPVILIGIRSMSGFFATCIVAQIGQDVVRSIREKIFH
ncbi:MAG: hypothetical protein LBB38_02085, partial [Puniceicoccales bacterium]|nr:hypothetical protein [Puniceicoccales bacterium]